MKWTVIRTDNPRTSFAVADVDSMFETEQAAKDRAEILNEYGYDLDDAVAEVIDKEING